MLVRWARGIALLFFGYAALCVNAAQLQVLIDSDNRSATGCTVPVPGGTFQGVERVLDTTVDTSTNPPSVGAVTQRQCVAPATNTLGAPTPVSAGGWNVGVGQGVNGYDVIETFFPTASPFGTYRLGFVYIDQAIGSDVLVSTTDTFGGPPILFFLGDPPGPIPTLTDFGLLLLAAVLSGVAVVVLRRHRAPLSMIVAALAVFLTTSAWAAIVLDGLVGDWTGVPPLATDAIGDAPAGSDMSAAFASVDAAAGRVYFRADVNIKNAQTIMFTSSVPLGASVGGPAYNVTATASSGLPVALTIDAAASAVCSIAGSTVSFIGAGTCLIDANQSGSATYSPAPQVQQSFPVVAPPSAGDDSHAVTGNIPIGPAAPGVLDNDSGTNIGIVSYGAPNGTEQTSIGTATPTAQGGSVSLAPDGSYTYDPPANFTGADTFKYRIDSAANLPSTGTVTLNVADRVMFVASAGVGAADCTPTASCTLATAGTAAAVVAGKDLIFVQSGAYASAAITLKNGQKMVGQKVSIAQALTDAGITLAVDSVPLAFAASTTPTLANTGTVVALGGGNLVEYLNINPSSGAAILGNNITTGAIVHDIVVTATGSANGIQLTGTSAGGTFNFSNLAITTASGSAFSAVGPGPGAGTGGTVNVTTGTLPNTLAAAGGAALNVVNTTIGAGGLNFRSLSATGGASGIVLDNTGASGGLTVTGNGNASVGGDASGGTIQNTTAAGIALTSTRNVVLTNLSIHDTNQSGIAGTGVTNFTFANGSIDNSGTGLGVDDSNLRFDVAVGGTENNVDGTLTITSNILSNAYYHGIDVQNFSGTLTSVNISNNTITSSTVGTAGVFPSSQGTGIRLFANGSASTAASIQAATVQSNNVSNFPSGAGIYVQGGNVSPVGPSPASSFGTGGSPLVIDKNSVQGQSAGNRMGTNGILVVIQGKGTAFANTTDNGSAASPTGTAITNVAGSVIGYSAFATTVTGTMSGNVVASNNSGGGIGVTGGATYQFSNADTPALNATVVNNAISANDGSGIYLLVNNSNGILNAKIQNNTVAAPLAGVRTGIRVDSQTSLAGTGNTTVCLNIADNVTAGSGGDPGIGLRKEGTVSTTNAFGVNAMAAATATPDVENFVNGLNPGSATGIFGVGGTLLLSATSGFQNCVLP